mgnify:CR=1 FL=1
MKHSVWKTICIVLLSMLVGKHFSASSIVPQVSAAPGDIRGSSLIAVTSYRNRAGSFVLWSDGRISSVDDPNTSISVLSNYTEIPGLSKLNLSVKSPKGSPNIPVGAYQDSKGSYILFSDGSSKKPSGIAGAPGINTYSVRSVRCDTSHGFQLYPPDSGIGIQGTGSVGHYTVTFDPPFKNPPVVTISSQSLSSVDGPASTTSVGVSTAYIMGGPTISVFQNMMFTVTAIGE